MVSPKFGTLGNLTAVVLAQVWLLSQKNIEGRQIAARKSSHQIDIPLSIPRKHLEGGALARARSLCSSTAIRRRAWVRLNVSVFAEISDPHIICTALGERKSL